MLMVWLISTDLYLLWYFVDGKRQSVVYCSSCLFQELVLPLYTAAQTLLHLETEIWTHAVIKNLLHTKVQYIVIMYFNDQSINLKTRMMYFLNLINVMYFWQQLEIQNKTIHTTCTKYNLFCTVMKIMFGNK